MKIRSKKTGATYESDTLTNDHNSYVDYNLKKYIIFSVDDDDWEWVDVEDTLTSKVEDTHTSKEDNPFKRITDTMVDTYTKKNKDYGDSFATSVEKYGLIAALTRMSDKFNRCENLVLNNEDNKVTDEKLQDTLLDLASYAVMTIIELNKKDNG